MRIVEQTGGIKYQMPKQEMQAWSQKPSVSWIPKCNKKDFVWARKTKKFGLHEFIYFAAALPK
jgi:hypothetical protein